MLRGLLVVESSGFGPFGSAGLGRRDCRKLEKVIGWGMGALVAILILGGLGLIGYAYFVMDVSIGSVGVTQIANLDLMSRREIIVIFGATAIIVGVIMAAVDSTQQLIVARMPLAPTEVKPSPRIPGQPEAEGFDGWVCRCGKRNGPEATECWGCRRSKNAII